MSTPTKATIDAVWRIESPRVIGALVRMVRDVDLAEDLAHEALVSALEVWPQAGIPDKPGAWLMAASKNRALDELRRRKRVEGKHERYAADLPGAVDPDVARALDEDVGDDVLRLVLVACDPILPPDARVALTLRLLGGLSTEEIARAFLTPEPTIAQRIVRAKRTLSEAKVPFEVPRGAELSARLPSVLEVVYLIFNEGYAATRGTDWMRTSLCDDALRLARVLTQLLPDEAEVHALTALLELQASRAKARVGPDGEPILLLEQDRSRWDQLLIRRGLAALARAEALAGSRGSYGLQAAIAACHARARTAEETSWPRIVELYGELVALTQSPVVELNRAVAVSMATGPAEALAIVEALSEALHGYHLLPSVRGELLQRLGRFDEARAELEAAAALTNNERERALLLERAARCRASSETDDG